MDYSEFKEWEEFEIEPIEAMRVVKQSHDNKFGHKVSLSHLPIDKMGPQKS